MLNNTIDPEKKKTPQNALQPCIPSIMEPCLAVSFVDKASSPIPSSVKVDSSVIKSDVTTVQRLLTILTVINYIQYIYIYIII